MVRSFAVRTLTETQWLPEFLPRACAWMAIANALSILRERRRLVYADFHAEVVAWMTLA